MGMLCLHFSFSQVQTVKKSNEIILKGNVTNKSNGRPIPFATIHFSALESLHEEKYVVSSDSMGIFNLKIVRGDYLVRSTIIGYLLFEDKINTDNFIAEKRLNIELTSESKMLEEITVEGKKKNMEMVPGGFKYNVGGLASSTSNSLELLRRVPLMMSDGATNIQLQGKEPVVYINGKRLLLSGQDLANYLKQIPSIDIESVEVLTNPTSKYDSDGEAGILNIKLKQKSISGLFGNISSNVSTLFGTDQGGTINYRKDKLDLSASYNFTYREDHYVRNNRFNNKLLPDSSRFFKQDMVSDKADRGHSAKFAIAYSLDSSSTLSGSFWAAFYHSNSPWIINSEIVDNEGLLTSKYTQNDKNLINNRFLLYDLAYEKNFRNKSKLNIAGNISRYNNKALNSYDRMFFNTDGSPIEDKFAEDRKMETERPYKSYSGTIDYSNKSFLNGEVNLGMKYTSTTTESSFRNYLYDSSKQRYINDGQLSSELNFNETIAAAYGSYSKKLNHFSYQIGLRFEAFKYDLNTTQLEDAYSNDYSNLFPNLNISYSKGENAPRYSLSYGRRIQRPRYPMLNPFLNTSMLGLYTRGNPVLQPYFTDKIEFQISKNYGKGNFVMLSASFNQSNDMYNSAIRFDEKYNMPVSDYENSWILKQYGIYLVTQNKFGRFSINTYLSGGYNNFNSGTKTDQFFSEMFSFVGNANLSYDFTKSTNIWLFGYYVSNSTMFQTKNLATGSISAGIQQKLLKNKLALSMKIEDMFNINDHPVMIMNQSFNLDVNNKLKSRYLSFGVQYNFGKTFGKKNTIDQKKDNRTE
ncbi:hypothetical protein A9970_27405 [Sphingobacterium sp. UME9]|nr:hypothetical protein [Sphingobacterium sp. UME9]